MVRLIEKPDLLEYPPLTAADRCDQCGSAAKMRAIMTNGDLLFCRHHGQEHLPKLVEVALDVRIEPLDEPSK
jgi:hypothetical protein